MAKIDILASWILSFEGGFVNDNYDAGGATNKGVTLYTWEKHGYDKNGDGKIDVEDLKLITDADATRIMKANYWDRWQADQIQDQSLANILVDWVWGSGKYGITIPQQMLGVKVDGIVGTKTIAALNKENPEVFFNKVKFKREQFFRDICDRRPANNRFLKGWLRRLDAIGYGYLIYNSVPKKMVSF